MSVVVHAILVHVRILLFPMSTAPSNGVINTCPSVMIVHWCYIACSVTLSSRVFSHAERDSATWNERRSRSCFVLGCVRGIDHSRFIESNLLIGLCKFDLSIPQNNSGGGAKVKLIECPIYTS